MIPGRLVVIAFVAAVIAAGVASSASAALFFLFKPTSADAGDVVTVRLGGTPADFTLEQREKPFRSGIRLYLVPSRVAGEISSRFDPRLHFIGRIVPDRNRRGVLSFRVPPVDGGPRVASAARDLGELGIRDYSWAAADRQLGERGQVPERGLLADHRAR